MGAKKKLPSDNNEESKQNGDLLKNNVLGIKVKGLKITFYIIPITEQIITTMSTLNRATLKTTVKTYGPFDFRVQPERKEIIETLDIFHQIITYQGRRNNRRNSGVKSE